MRSLFIVLVLVASHAQARESFEEVRELTLAADGIEALIIDAGAGDLEVAGVAGLQDIRVTATIRVRGNEEKARRKMADKMNLRLERDGAIAELDAMFRYEFWSIGQGPTIDIKVEVPGSIGLTIDDGTGSIELRDVGGDVTVRDGTGSMVLIGVGGTVNIDDGTGAIAVTGVGGDLRIDDGTGAIDVVGVDGSVTVDDGTGHIDVADVGEDLIIIASGAGGLRYENVQGSVSGRY